MITPSWLSGSLIPFFVQFFYVFFQCLLIYSASVSSIPCLFYCAHLCLKHSLLISNSLEEISDLCHSNVFLYFCTNHLGRLFFFFKSLLAILWNSALRQTQWVCLSFLFCLFLLFFSKLFVRPPQATILPFCISFFFFLRLSWWGMYRSKNDDHGIQSHHFMANTWKNNENSDILYFPGLQNHYR